MKRETRLRAFANLTLFFYWTQVVACMPGVSGPSHGSETPQAGEQSLGGTAPTPVRTEDPAADAVVTASSTPTDNWGDTPGSFRVTSTGQAAYSIPLWTPPGRAGVSPSLSLQYNSSTGAGLLGVGWNLSGISYITRCPKTFAQDGAPGPVKFSDPASIDGDALCLDGMRLFKVGSTTGDCETEYRKEIGGDTKIVAHGCGASEALRPGYFEVFEKSGRILRYGYDAPGLVSQSRLEGTKTTFTFEMTSATKTSTHLQSAVFAWALSEVRDRSQNYLAISYNLNTTDDLGRPLLDEYGNAAVEQVPKQIDYTGNYAASAGTSRSVVFGVEDNLDHRIRHVGGLALASIHRLSTITMSGPGVVGGSARDAQPDELRQYRLTYKPSSTTRRPLLQQVMECDGSSTLANCRPPIDLDWGCDSAITGCAQPDSPTKWAKTSLDFKVNTDFSDVTQTTYQNAPDFWTLKVVDIDGDGLDDICYRKPTTWIPEVTCPSGSYCWAPSLVLSADWYCRFSTGTGFSEERLAGLPPSDVGGSAFDPGFIDLDGNGTPEVLAFRKTGFDSFPFGSSLVWLPLGRVEKYTYGGSRDVSPIYPPPSEHEAEPAISRDTTIPDWFAPPGQVGQYPSIHGVDLDGDGLPDIARVLDSDGAGNLLQGPTFVPVRVHDPAWFYHRNVPGDLTPFTALLDSFATPNSANEKFGNMTGYAADVDGDGTPELLVQGHNYGFRPRMDDVHSPQLNAYSVRKGVPKAIDTALLGAPWDEFGSAWQTAVGGVSTDTPYGGTDSHFWYQYLFIDVSGDGLPDVVAFQRERNPSGFDRARAGCGNDWSRPECIWHGGYDGNFYVAINTGSGFGPFAKWAVPGFVVSPMQQAKDSRYLDIGLRAADIDRDGKMDLVLMDNGASTGLPRAHLVVLRSTGLSFEKIALQIPVGDSTGNGPSKAQANPFVPWFWPYDSCLGPGSCTGTLESQPGQTWNCECAWGYGQRLSQVLDANGDGLPDFIQVEGGYPQLYINQGESPDLLRSVSPGFQRSQITDIEYRSIANASAAYTPGVGCGFPQSCLKSGLRVVAGYRERVAQAVAPFSAEHARHFHYTYEDARIDRQGRGLLGFKSVKETEEISGTERTSEFEFQFPLTGMLKTEKLVVPVGDGRTSRRSERSVSNCALDQAVASLPGACSPLTQTSFAPAVLVYPQETRVQVFEDVANAGTTTSTPLRDETVSQVQDSFGNVTSSSRKIVDLNGGLGSEYITLAVSTEFPSSPDRTNWLVAQAQKEVTSISSGPLSIPTLRTSKFHYDAIGRLSHVYQEPESARDPVTGLYSKRLTTALTRDEYGLVTVVETTDGDSTRSERIEEYDGADHTFPYRTINGAGHELRYWYHSGLGVLVQTGDANGLVRRSQYDRFARLRAVDTLSRPPLAPFPSRDTTVTYSPASAGGCCGQFIFSSTVDSGWRTTVLDDAGRAVSTSVPGSDGSVIDVQTGYDALGHPSLRTHPRANGSSMPLRATLFHPDNLGRATDIVTQTVTADSTVGTPAGTVLPSARDYHVWNEYSGLTTITHDNGQPEHRTTTTANAVGSPYKVVEAGADGEVAVSYFYKPFGPLATTKIEKGGATLATTSVDYDSLYRKTSLSDPDTGTSSWHYNAWNEIARIDEQNGSVTTYLRDAIGRITDENVAAFGSSGAPSTATYTWDEVANGWGRLGHATSPDGVDIAFTYDAFSRVATETHAVATSKYALDYTYDLHGRLSTLIYPAVSYRALGGHRKTDRFAVDYLYSDETDGSVSGIVNHYTQAPYWTRVGMSSDGQLADEILGNGLETKRRFDSDGRLSFVDTRAVTPGAVAPGLVDPGVVQGMAYGYNVDGTLAASHDLVAGIDEAFGYDALGRLATWDVVSAAGNAGASTCGSSSWRYSYDDLGNLLSRIVTKGLGESLVMDYDPSANGGGPHAVKTAQFARYGPSGLVPGSYRSYEYGYDKVGNQETVNRLSGVANTERSAKYTSFNLPGTISANGLTYSLKYDAFHKRALKESGPLDSTIYVGELYERRVTTSGTDHVFNVVGPNGMVMQQHWGALGPVAARSLYLHKDRLGSIQTVTDELAQVVEQMKTDPFGARRDPANPAGPYQGAGSVTGRGFAELEIDLDLGLVNMRGRLYDPELGRFLSADPLVTHPFFSQGFNRYSYALNNPLSYVDPSGFDVDSPEGYQAQIDEYTQDGELASSNPYVMGVDTNWNAGHGYETTVTPTNSGTSDPTADRPPEVEGHITIVDQGTAAGEIRMGEIQGRARFYGLDPGAEMQKFFRSQGYPNVGIATNGYYGVDPINVANRKAWSDAGDQANDVADWWIGGSLAKAVVSMFAVAGTVKASTGAAKEAEKALPDLPKLDATGKVHGELPNLKDLRRYDPEDLASLRDELQQSVHKRIEVNTLLGSDPGHSQRQAAEQRLIQAITKSLEDQ